MSDKSDLIELVETVKQEDLLSLLEKFFEDKEFVAAFKKAPASTRYHGNFAGGLEEHVIGVAKLCDAAVAHYGGGINRDLLITGALLHDIGKIHCYEKATGNGPFQGYLTTSTGKMFGHIAIGVVEIHDIMKVINFPDPLASGLEHMVLSHHGPVSNGWGSSVDPLTKEAITLHYADLMDSRVAGAVKHG